MKLVALILLLLNLAFFPAYTSVNCGDEHIAQAEGNVSESQNETSKMVHCMSCHHLYDRANQTVYLQPGELLAVPEALITQLPLSLFNPGPLLEPPSFV